MSKDVIKVHGQDRVVREDTAKAYRGVNWMIASLVGFIVILTLVAAIFFLQAATDGDIDNPAAIENSNRR